jgi:hypothetical protein
MLTSPRQSELPPPGAGHAAEQLLQGVFEPPSGVVWAGIRRNWPIVVALSLILALAGLAVGLRRQSTYTAAATLQVGQVNPNSPGFYSYVSSAAALATAFSRGVSAEPVLDSVHDKLGLRPTQAAARLSAEPLPLSPAFRVFATGSSSAAAIELANTTAAALVAYEGEVNNSNPQATSLLHEYRGASVELHRASNNLARLQELSGKRGRRRVSAEALVGARAARDTAAARLSAVGNAYTAAVTSQAPRRGLVSLLAGATSATSNHRANVELGGFIGLLAGIVLGSAIAALREHRRVVAGDLAQPATGLRAPEHA